MADVIEWNPTQGAAVAAGQSLRAATQSPLPVTQDQLVLDEGKPSAMETAAAIWRHDTILGTAMSEYGFIQPSNDVAAYAPGWNPIGFFIENKDEFKDIEPWLRRGVMDRTYNEAQFRTYAERIRAELRDIKTIDQGSGAGIALGMGLSLLDVTTLIPFGAPARGVSAARNAARVAAGGALMQGGQELLLHQAQEARTKEESFLNIGIVSALGGGIGIASSILHPASALNPKNGAKALDPEVPHDTGVLIPGQSVSEAETISVGSVGSAKVGDDGSYLAGRESMWAKGLKVIRSATPVGRATEWTGMQAREAMQGLLDLGGTITKHMRDGVVRGPSVEDLERDWKVVMQQSLQERSNAWFELQGEIGGTQSRIMARLQQDASLLTAGKVNLGKLGEHDFNKIIYQKLTDDLWQGSGVMDDGGKEWLKKFLSERGLDYETYGAAVEKYSDKAAKEIQKGLLKLEGGMTQFGMLDAEKAKGKAYGLPQLWHRPNIQSNPNQARDYFLEVFSKRPTDEWLQANYAKPGSESTEAAGGKSVTPSQGMTLEDFNALPAMDPKRIEILEAWTGDKAVLDLERASSRLAQAEAALREATDLSAVVDLGIDVAKRDHKRLSVAALRAEVRAQERSIAVRGLEIARAKQLDAEERLARIDNRLNGDDPQDLAEAALRDRQAQGANLDLQGQAAAKARGEVSDFTDALKGVREDLKVARQLDPDEAARLRKERDALLQEVGAAREAYRTAVSEFRANAKAMKATDKWLDAAVRAADEGKEARKLVGQIEGTEAALAKSQERMAQLAAKLDNATAARKAAWAEYKTLRKAGAMTKVDTRAARKDVRKATRGMKQAQRQSAMLDHIDDLVGTLKSSERAPIGIVKDRIGESDRVKERMINLTTAERRLAEEKGLLHTDLDYLMERVYSDISPRLALREVFGEEDLAKTIAKVSREYEDLQRKAGSEKSRAALAAEFQAVKKDMEVVRDRLLNRAGIPDDPDSLVAWGLGKLRALTFLRFAAGFPISSLTDLASQVLHVGVGKESLKAAGKISAILRGAKIDPDSKELLGWLRASEGMLAHATASRLYMLDDLQYSMGVGPAGTFKQKATASVDRVVDTLTARMNTWSGMAAFNGIGKGVAGAVQVTNIQRMVGEYDKLPVGKRTQLASIGIGRDEASKLKRFFDTYGQWDEDNVLFSPNAHKWGIMGASGDEAHRILRVAVQRTMNRAVMTPGYGDTPLFMSSALGKALLQFQSFGFTSVNRYFTPAIQRAGMDGDLQAISSFLTLFALGTMVTAVRGYMNGKNPAEYTAMQWTKEVLDRSGAMVYLSPYMDAGLKATGLDPGGVSTRYRNNKWWESLMGPWLGTLNTAGQAGNAAIQGDTAKLREKAFLLTPFNQWWRIGNALVTEPAEQ